MAKQKTKKNSEAENNEPLKPLDEETRFRYIGLEVFGKSDKDFFTSDQEKKQHEKTVEEYQKKNFSPFRGCTAVNRNLLTQTDKIVFTISSLILIISAFMPWMSFKTNWVSLKFTGLLGFFQASQYTDIINMFNPKLMLFVYVPALMALLAFVFGVVTLIAIYLPAKSPEGLQNRLKTIMGLQWWPLAIWLAFFIVSIVGISLPFGEWMAESYGVKGVSNQVNIVTFTSLSGIGVWMSIAAFVMNSVKANDF